MKHCVSVIIFCFVAFPAFAQHQVKDIWAPKAQPAPIAPSPGATDGNAAFPAPTPYNSSAAASGNNDPVQQRIRNILAGNNNKTATGFMGNYCDPANSPVANANIAHCMQSQKQQACDQFDALPQDARSAIEDNVNCLSAITTMNEAAACAPTDTRRLALIQKYWQDEATASALVFLPDMVLGGAKQCQQGGR